MDTSRMRVRKLLSTVGYYSTDISRKMQESYPDKERMESDKVYGNSIYGERLKSVMEGRVRY